MRDAATLTVTQQAKARRKIIFKRAEKYVKEYRSQEKEEVRLKRVARAAGDYYVPGQAKVYFAIRIKGSVRSHSSVFDGI
jgi:large subunit ribosomal protein L7e